jgi:hypothetical protein
MIVLRFPWYVEISDTWFQYRLPSIFMQNAHQQYPSVLTPLFKSFHRFWIFHPAQTIIARIVFVSTVIFSSISHILIEKILSKIIITLWCTMCTAAQLSVWLPPPYRGFTITFRHTTIGSTLLAEWSARRRDLYLTTHNTHKIQKPLPIRCR